MQLHALTEKQVIIAANKASKRCDYFCLECAGLVRLRGGLHRQNHFFHIQPTTSCKLNGKGMRHLQVQIALQRAFPEGIILLEKRFPQIGRIADAVWEERKIIFEVQCSSITPEEIKARNEDYQFLGYQVIWILHEALYNKFRATAAEYFLENLPHYFTNIDREGSGIIYDQYSILLKGIRLARLEKRSIDIAEIRTQNSLKSIFPENLRKRLTSYPYYFAGDVVDRSLKDAAYLEKIMNLEKENSMLAISPTFSFSQVLEKTIFRPYRILFRYLLECACR